MQSPSEWRSFESDDCRIMVRENADGNFTVKLQAGAVSIRTAVPKEIVAALFSAERAA